MIHKCLMIQFMLLFLCFIVSGAEKSNEIRVPDWIQSEKALKVSQIPEDDYPYLVGWLDKNSNSPEDYVIDLFKRHQVVILGEMSWVVYYTKSMETAFFRYGWGQGGLHLWKKS